MKKKERPRVGKNLDKAMSQKLDIEQPNDILPTP